MATVHQIPSSDRSSPSAFTRIDSEAFHKRREQIHKINLFLRESGSFIIYDLKGGLHPYKMQFHIQFGGKTVSKQINFNVSPNGEVRVCGRMHTFRTLEEFLYTYGRDPKKRFSSSNLNQ